MLKPKPRDGRADGVGLRGAGLRGSAVRALALCVAVAGCGSEGDGGRLDATDGRLDATDASTIDAVDRDVALQDVGRSDVATADVGSMDTAPTDVATPDASPPDATGLDTGPRDTGSPEVSPPDSATPSFACRAVDGSRDRAVVNMAANLNGSGTSLAAFMAMNPTPGVSVAWRDVEGVVHTAVFGNANNAVFDSSARPLSPTTVFQAGSVSKPVSALAYLMSDLVDSTLDVDLRPAVDSLVASTYAVTPSDLLTHTAGTSVHGFGGYAPGRALPSVDQIVLGLPPANSMAVTFGTRGPWLYSGGGYMLWEAWLDRTARQDLPSFVRDRLFIPAGATRSSFAQPPAATEHDAACGLDPVHLPGVCRNNYPEYAAAGLWTTPTDLTCMAGYAATRRGDALARVMSRAITIPSYPQRQGLGLRHRPANGSNESAGHFYEHSGVNYGFCTQLAFFSDGRAVATMDNSCRGASSLAARALCRELGWPCAGANMNVR